MEKWICSLRHGRTDIVAKNLQTPIMWRRLEGLSTTMLLGFIAGGGGLLTPLGFVYAMHWRASYRHHSHPSVTSFLVDMHYIDMVMMERVSYVYDKWWIHPLFAFLMLTGMERTHRFFLMLKVMMVVACLFLSNQNLLFSYYMLSWIMAACFYMISDMLLVLSWCRLKVLSHVAFHFCLTWTSCIENDLYKKHPQYFTPTRLAVYALYMWCSNRLIQDRDVVS